VIFFPDSEKLNKKIKYLFANIEINNMSPYKNLKTKNLKIRLIKYLKYK
jgi:hypothetical protein